MQEVYYAAQISERQVENANAGTALEKSCLLDGEVQ
jgi:hypothetical protein